MQKRNEGFICMGCGKDVHPADRTSRNHCPYCFLSLHVDDLLPGDRAAICGGEMVPVDFSQTNGSMKIKFQCLSCGKIHWNKTAQDDTRSDIQNAIDHWKIRVETSQSS